MLKKPKHLLRHVTLFNLILLAAVIYAADYTIFHSLSLNTTKSTSPSTSASKPVEEKRDEAEQKPGPSPIEYTIIAEHNLFHPERIIPPEKKAGPELPKPEFFLYGTLITSDVMIAYMEDKKSPQSTPGREKRQTALRKGDTLSGYTLKDIMPDKVTMAKGGEFIDVSLNASKTREFASAQPAGAPAGAPGGPPFVQTAPPSPGQAGGPGASKRVRQAPGPPPSAQAGGSASSPSSSGQQTGSQAGGSTSSSSGQQTGTEGVVSDYMLTSPDEKAISDLRRRRLRGQ